MWTDALESMEMEQEHDERWKTSWTGTRKGTGLKISQIKVGDETKKERNRKRNISM